MKQKLNDMNSCQKQHFLQVLGSSSDTCVYSHAYIIQGAYGVGKTDFALFCAGAILCKEVNPPCGKCNSCQKTFSLTHPDIHFYGGDDGKPITMRQVRQLIDSSVLIPNDGEKKIYIIKEAHKMRPDTQNAILKIFEEPPESVVIFLLTEKKEALLPTILSRGQLITLTGESDEYIEDYLVKKHKKASQEEIKTAVRAAEGSVGQAELFMSKENREAMLKAIEILDKLFEGERMDFYNTIISSKVKREKIVDLLGLLQRLFSDILEYKYNISQPVLLSAKNVQRYAGRITKKALSLMNTAVADCRKSLEQSGNINAAVTNLCIRLWALKS